MSATFDVTSSLTKYAAFDFGVGDISIQKSASFSLINTFDCAFQGDINIEKDCEFLIASTAKALKLTFNNIFHKIENKGKWIVHTLESAAASTCNIIVKSFVNTGEIILAFKGHVLAPIINITASHWVNHGCLHLFQEIKSISVAILGVVGGTIENHGTICLTNQLCKQVTKLLVVGVLPWKNLLHSLFPTHSCQLMLNILSTWVKVIQLFKLKQCHSHKHSRLPILVLMVLIKLV